MSFRLKTILGVAAIEAILLAILIGSSLDFLHRSYEEELFKRARTTASLVANATRDAVLSTDLATLESFIAELVREDGLSYARVLDREQRVLAQAGIPESLARPFEGDIHYETITDGVFDQFAPIVVAGIPFGRVELGLPTAFVDRAMSRAFRRTSLLAVLEMALVALFSYGLGTYLTRQLGGLKEGAERVAGGELGFQVPTKGVDELAVTARAFNEMSRRLAELYDEVRRSEQRFRGFSEASSDWFWETDDQLRFCYFSENAPNVLGRSTGEFMGMSDWQAFGALGPEAPGWREHGKQMADRQPFRDFEFRLQDVAEERWLRISGQPFLADDGRFLGYRGTGRDITLRRHTEDTVRKLSLAVEQSPVSVVITDTSGAIEYVNPKFVEVTGYSFEEAIGNNPRILKTPLTPAQVHEDLWRTLAMGDVWQGQFCNRRKDGSLYWEFATISPIRANDGEVTHYVAVKEDVSHRLEAERERDKLLADLKRSNAELEQFAYVASHDLREPLRVITGYLNLLRDDYHGRLSADADEFIGFAIQGAERMARLISELLDYSRLETRGRPFAPVDLGEVVKIALLHLGLVIAETHAVVEIATLPVVDGDEIQLISLYQNLLGNALKYRHPARPPRVRVDVEQVGTEWHFHVSDNGIGIDARHSEKVFEIFQRLHPSSRYEGTGIGLAVCKKIVGRHGGRIWLDSTVGQGSTFTFTVQRILIPPQARSPGTGSGA